MGLFGKIVVGAALVASAVVAFAVYKYNIDAKTRAEINCKMAWHELVGEVNNGDRVVWGEFARWSPSGGDTYRLFIGLENRLGFKIEPGTCAYNSTTDELWVTRPPA